MKLYVAHKGLINIYENQWQFKNRRPNTSWMEFNKYNLNAIALTKK